MILNEQDVLELKEYVQLLLKYEHRLRMTYNIDTTEGSK